MPSGGVGGVFGTEVRADAVGTALNGFEDSPCRGDEGFPVIGARFVFDLLLEIIVEIFIGIMLGRIQSMKTELETDMKAAEEAYANGIRAGIQIGKLETFEGLKLAIN